MYSMKIYLTEHAFHKRKYYFLRTTSIYERRNEGAPYD